MRFAARHQAGDRIAAGECLVYCVDHGIQVPEWVLAEEAERWRRYLAGGTAQRAFVGGQLGRHADPRTANAEQVRREESVASMRAATCAGLHGRQWILEGASVYDHRNPDQMIDTETMQKHYQAWRRGQAWVAPIADPNALLVTVSGQLHDLRQSGALHYDVTVSGILGFR